MSCEVVKTRWGSWAMRDHDAGEVMHPGVGPLIEAETLYVQQSQLAHRLQNTQRRRLVVFDVGLGAGSNALAAWLVAHQTPASAASLEIVSFEKSLEALQLALKNHERFGFEGAALIAAHALLDRGSHEDERTLWRLQHGDVLERLAQETARADVVFWDPFSPKVNPNLWTVGAFTAMRAAAGPEATLFTYSASTTVRMALLLAGWHVGVGIPTGQKATTTVAAVRLQDLEAPLDRAWLSRIDRTDLRLPEDAGENAVVRTKACHQFCVEGPPQTT